MKKFLIILLGFVFIMGSGCASLDIQPEVNEQPTFRFPLIGDINFIHLRPQVFVFRGLIDINKIVTVSEYPEKTIRFVRIISNLRFQINEVQYLKKGELFVYKYIDNKGTDYLYSRDLTLSKEEIAEITKKLMRFIAAK